jgi:hypothetical protein
MDMPDDRWMDPEWRKTRPKPGTPEYQKQQEQLTAYLTAVGTLITIFSGLENTLFGTLGALTTAPTPMALALFSDVRIDQAMNMIRRVMRARQQMFGSTAREKRIERIVTYALDQISILNGIRNHIIHHGLWPGSIENPTTTNIMRARTLDQVREISISVEDLK